MKNGDELDAEGAEVDALRERLAADLEDEEKLVASSGTLLGYRYAGSDIIVPDATPELEDDARRYISITRPGHRAPHVWLENDDALYDRFDQGFNVLQLGGTALDVTPFVDYASTIGLPLNAVRINDALVHDVYAADLVLVHPGLIIAWRADAVPGNVQAVLDRLRGS